MGLRAGRLNKRVTIQQVTRTADGGGGYTEAWGTLATMWARVTPTDGLERFEGQQTQGTLRYEVEIRHRTDVTSAMRLSYDSRSLYIIQPPFSPDEKRESLVLICEERQA